MSSERSSRVRSMLPREHGAWPQLLLPLATALVCWPSVAAALLSLAAIAAFFAHEPALVLFGHRGSKASRERPRALRWALVSALVTIASLAVAWNLSSISNSGVALWVPALLAALLFVLARLRVERTDLGEALASVALSSAAWPVAVAGGATLAHGARVWFVFAVGFVAMTGAVRATLAGPKKRDPRRSRWLSIVGVLVAVASARWCWGATLVAAASAGWLLAAPSSAKNIRRTGWSLAAGSMATMLWLIAARYGSC